MDEFRLHTAQLRQTLGGLQQEVAALRAAAARPALDGPSPPEEASPVMVRILEEHAQQRRQLREQYEERLAAVEAERDSLSSELCGRELRLHDQVKRIAQLQAAVTQATSQLSESERDCNVLREQEKVRQAALAEVQAALQGLRLRSQQCAAVQAQCAEAEGRLKGLLQAALVTNDRLAAAVGDADARRREDGQVALVLREERDRLALEVAAAQGSGRGCRELLGSLHNIIWLLDRRRLAADEASERAEVAQRQADQQLQAALQHAAGQAATLRRLGAELTAARLAAFRLREGSQREWPAPQQTETRDAATDALAEDVWPGSPPSPLARLADAAEEPAGERDLRVRCDALEDQLLRQRQETLDAQQKALAVELATGLQETRIMFLSDMNDVLQEKMAALQRVLENNASAMSDLGLQLMKERNERDALELEVESLKRKAQLTGEQPPAASPPAAGRHVGPAMLQVPSSNVNARLMAFPSLLAPTAPSPNATTDAHGESGGLSVGGQPPSSLLQCPPAKPLAASPGRSLQLTLGGQIDLSVPLPSPGKRPKKPALRGNSSAGDIVSTCGRCGQGIKDRLVTCSECHVTFHAYCFAGRQNFDHSLCQNCAGEVAAGPLRPLPKKRRLLRVEADNLL